MPPLLSEGQVVRNHRIVRRIGTGGMGEVYEAVHQTLQRRVAIKVLHPDWCKNPDLVKRFFNEALATNLIRHPAMVAIHDHGQFPDGMPFLIMEFLEGESLRRFHGKLEPLQVVRIGWQVASGLSAAHAKKIIHRDMKPDNVMVVRDDAMPGGQRVKILDFGLAKLAVEHQRAGAQAVSTRDGVALGTPEYMAPEQWLGAARVDGKADVYSLGVVLYETLAGVPPFSSPESDKLRSMHLYAAAPPLSSRVIGLPPDLVRLIEQMLSKTQADRPAMSEVTTRLETLMRELSADTHIPVLSTTSTENSATGLSLNSGPVGAARSETSLAPDDSSGTTGRQVAALVQSPAQSPAQAPSPQPKAAATESPAPAEDDGLQSPMVRRMVLTAAIGFFVASLFWLLILLLRR